jgi:predicted nucleic acid-binding protein
MVKGRKETDMPFVKKTAKIDVHIWLEEKHLAILDRIASEYVISRAAVMAQLLEDYENTHKEKTDVSLPRDND